MTKIFLLFLACIAAIATAGHAETQKERTVAAIEAAGCTIDDTNINAVLNGLGLSDEAFRVIGEELVAEGLADVSQIGIFRLTTPACTATARTQTARAVAAIEAAGCVVDRSNINEILDGLGLADDDFRAIGEALIAEGQAQVSDAGAFQLTTPNCS
ncbi:ribosomal protein L12E/L44/L45/RPP1/RPP2 [Roseovarius sp. MBR-51]